MIEGLRARMVEIDDAILAPLHGGEKELFLSLLKRLA
jgi:hypothetical protein